MKQQLDDVQNFLMDSTYSKIIQIIEFASLDKDSCEPNANASAELKANIHTLCDAVIEFSKLGRNNRQRRPLNSRINQLTRQIVENAEFIGEIEEDLEEGLEDEQEVVNLNGLNTKRIVELPENKGIEDLRLCKVKEGRGGSEFIKFIFFDGSHANLFPNNIQGIDFSDFQNLLINNYNYEDFLEATMISFTKISSQNSKHPDKIKLTFNPQKVQDYFDILEGKAKQSPFEKDSGIYVDEDLNNIYVDEKLAEIWNGYHVEKGSFGRTYNFQLQEAIINCFSKLDQSHLRNYLDQVLVNTRWDYMEEHYELIINPDDIKFAEQLLKRYEDLADRLQNRKEDVK